MTFTVVIADDDADIRELVTIAVTRAGLNVVAAVADGAACQWPFGTARGRPAEMPAGGHENCPLMANRSAHQGFGGVGHAQLCSLSSSR